VCITLLRTCRAFRALGMLDASTVMTGPWFPGHIQTLMARHQWSVLRNLGSLFAHSSTSCTTSRRSCCFSGDSSLGTNFATTLRMPKSTVKIVSNDGLPWSMSTLYQWHQHFSSLMVSHNVLHHFAIWYRQTHLAVLWGGKKSCMCMKFPSSTTLFLPPFRHYLPL
jgi:hypothetical protein